MRLRRSGLLLHPTSLPSPFGIGDLGPEALRFVDFLVRARQAWWQILPLNPPGKGFSPYAASSAFAGNPWLISPEELVREGLLEEAALRAAPAFPPERVLPERVLPYKADLLRAAFEAFRAGRASHLQAPFEAFCARHASWLEEYALFQALREVHGRPWPRWPAPLARRDPAALRKAREDLRERIEFHRFVQFLFFRQWARLRAYAAERGVRILGDIPIFVAHDSADVWAHPELFHLDEAGEPTVVAGVPPDLFSPTGQRWGNPLYRWEVLQSREFDWWRARIRVLLELVDRIRLDHFRGLEACWTIPASCPTAEEGEWVPVPGEAFLERLRQELGDPLPLVAEDLGFITPAVEALRDRFGLPGMRILQFAFGEGPENEHLPHNHPRRCVVYPGTHDNDTAVGWYRSAPRRVRRHLRRYVGVRRIADPAWTLIRLALASVAELAVIPVQDLLSLGSEARMNVPGRPDGNWRWRLEPGALTPALADRLGEMTELYGRGPGSPPPPAEGDP